LINCSLIGYGKWGKNIFKVLSKSNKVKIDSICKKNIKYFSNFKFNCRVLNSYKKGINKDINAVFIATPPESHFKIAKYALESKKNVFIEKPVCLSQKNYRLLTKIAKKNDLVFHIDYIHTYNQNLIKLISKLNKSKQKKEKIYIKIFLGKNGPVGKKSLVLMDWGPHIFSIINFIFKHNKYKINKVNILKNSNKKKINFSLNINYKNIIIDAFFGNNFKNKITEININKKNSQYIYKDKILITKNNNSFYKKNYQKISPLENSINQFIKSCKKNIYIHDKLHEKITYQLEKIQIKLFN
tara:strand:- start:9175 stop:10071 length:897 start_codon:yes stop_codon:yes gene_type:complete